MQIYKSKGADPAPYLLRELQKMALQNSGMNWGKQGRLRRQRKQGENFRSCQIIPLSLQRSKNKLSNFWNQNNFFSPCPLPL
jgi:hypothetical protein